MPRGPRRDPNKERFWKRMIQQWQRSGLSVRRFCQQHGLSEANFYAWKRTLAEREAHTLNFVPVEILPETTPAHTLDLTPVGLELLLPGGRVLRVGPAFDEPTLRRLLAVLQEAKP